MLNNLKAVHDRNKILDELAARYKSPPPPPLDFVLLTTHTGKRWFSKIYKVLHIIYKASKIQVDIGLQVKERLRINLTVFLFATSFEHFTKFSDILCSYVNILQSHTLYVYIHTHRVKSPY